MRKRYLTTVGALLAVCLTNTMVEAHDSQHTIPSDAPPAHSALATEVLFFPKTPRPWTG